MLKIIKGKINQAMRLLYVNSLTRWNDSIIIVEYPKSGGTWLGQLISTYFNIPFPRNKIPGLKRSVYHSHYLPNSKLLKNKKILYLVRDGRDVLISLYYHQLIWNDKNRLSPKDVIYHRNKLKFENYDNVSENLKEFMDYSYNDRPSKLQQFTYMGNWYEFNDRWLKEYNKEQSNIYFVKYENLLKDTYATMQAIIEQFFEGKVDSKRLRDTIKKFSFENQSKRQKGVENKNSFLRKGIAGDWQNHFNTNAKTRFKVLTNKMLVRLNYEEQDNW